MKTIIPVLVLLSGCSSVKPLVVASHMSDPSDGGESDHTADFIGAGATADLGGFTIDGVLGRKALDCSYKASCPSTLGAMLTVRWSPK
jgi:hypothetical protein